MHSQLVLEARGTSCDLMRTESLEEPMRLVTGELRGPIIKNATQESGRDEEDDPRGRSSWDRSMRANEENRMIQPWEHESIDFVRPRHCRA